MIRLETKIVFKMMMVCHCVGQFRSFYLLILHIVLSYGVFLPEFCHLQMDGQREPRILDVIIKNGAQISILQVLKTKGLVDVKQYTTFDDILCKLLNQTKLAKLTGSSTTGGSIS
ncbi:Uncharacterized protein TCM_035794 [Theobroma cacao]|uniref:Uncharacterized protein n=1 Tax=Theobroma cacao TaxID=3641 RepID=A0A061FQQ5_THECC|nr:Uncharacterized protein TCM_035794 [Theobroma cacao]